jgi:uncharacterized protein (TIGR02598 family)
MRPFFFRYRKSNPRDGFSLVEATLSIGVLSLGFLTLIPLLAVGLKTARVAHNNRDSTQIAQLLVEEAKQGTLTTGITYFDFQGNPVTSAVAAYTAQSTLSSVPGNAALSRLTLQIIPVGAPNRARTYAVVFPAAQ